MAMIVRGALVRRALVAGAQAVGGAVVVFMPEVLEARAAVGRRATQELGLLLVRKSWMAGGVHRPPVEEDGVGDDVAGVELPRVRRLRLLGRGAGGDRAQQRGADDDEDGEHPQHGAHHGTVGTWTSTASPVPCDVPDS